MVLQHGCMVVVLSIGNLENVCPPEYLTFAGFVVFGSNNVHYEPSTLFRSDICVCVA
jgi:hypothetical protein